MTKEQIEAILREHISVHPVEHCAVEMTGIPVAARKIFALFEEVLCQLSDIDLALESVCAETERGERVAEWIEMCHDAEVKAKALELIEKHKITVAAWSLNAPTAEPWAATKWQDKKLIHCFGATPAEAVIRLVNKLEDGEVLEGLIDSEIKEAQ